MFFSNIVLNYAISEHWKHTSGESQPMVSGGSQPMASGESQPMASEESTTPASVSSSVLNGSEDESRDVPDVPDFEAFRDPDKCSYST